MRYGNNIYPARDDIKVSGKNNYVADDAICIQIVGDGNKVHSRANNVNIFNSSGCTVLGGLSNVIFICSSGVTATESSSFYINNVKQEASKKQIRRAAGTYEPRVDDHTILADATTGNVTIVLPPASGIGTSSSTGTVFNTDLIGWIIIVKRIDASGNTVTITPEGSALIDGAASRAVASLVSYTLQSDGYNWHIIG